MLVTAQQLCINLSNIFKMIIVSFLHSASMGTIYAENKDEDGFLYVAFSGENTFGD